MNRLFNEPQFIAGAIRAVIFAAVAFGLKWTTEQIGAVMLAVEAVLTLVTRSLVTPNQLAEARVDQGNRPTNNDISLHEGNPLKPEAERVPPATMIPPATPTPPPAA